MEITLRPFRADELDLPQRLGSDATLAPGNWYGFKPTVKLAAEHAENNLIGEDLGRLVVDVGGEMAGFVSYVRGNYVARADYFDIGILLHPDFRGRGIGWRAQALLTDYLFEHFPVRRVQAGTQPENEAEQKALLKAGFQLEGRIRAAEFRAGQWRDCLLYSRLRDDPAPAIN